MAVKIQNEEQVVKDIAPDGALSFMSTDEAAVWCKSIKTTIRDTVKEGERNG
jgi:hypothetical protein